MRLLPWSLGLALAVATWLAVRETSDPVMTAGPTAPAASESRAEAASPTESSASMQRVEAGPSNPEVGKNIVHVAATMPNGDPAAAAVVRWGPAPEGYRNGESADREAWLTAHGSVVVADGSGVADVELGDARDAILSVRCADNYGEGSVSAGSGTVRVTLQRDEPLPLLLLDSDGRPRTDFRIDVEILTAPRHGHQQEYDFALQTDAQGFAFVPHTQQLTMPGSNVSGWSMHLRVRTNPPVERTVTAEEARAEHPLLLRLPAGGAIAVEVRLADGHWHWANIKLTDATTGVSKGPDWSSDDLSWFRQVPIGREWTIDVETFGHEARRNLTGPVRIDDVVHQTIELPLRRIGLHGRIKRPDGVPIPGAKIRLAANEVKTWHDGATESRDGSLADRVGSFSLDGVLPAEIDGVSGATLHVEREPYCARSTIALPPIHAGENDLGDIIVAVPPDEILLASVAVRAGGEDVTSRAHASVCGRGDRFVTDVIAFATRVDDRIVLRGPRTSRELEVGCSCPGYVFQRVPVRQGEHVVVDLARAASLQVRFQSSPDWPCTAQLTDPTGSDRRGYVHTSDGFEWHDAAPGRYRLRLFVAKQLVFEASAVDLAPGANTFPTDGALDLRRLDRVVRVDVVSPENLAVDDARCFAMRPDRAAPPADLDPQDVDPIGPWFVIQPWPVELLVTAPGFVPVVIPSASTDTTVPLASCTKLRVYTAGGTGTTTLVRVVDDPVRDPWLRVLDSGNLHRTLSYGHSDGQLEFWCIPGTVVDVAVEHDGAVGPSQRVTIGATTVEVTAH